jgi:biopolymer transport protein ExbB
MKSETRKSFRDLCNARVWAKWLLVLAVVVAISSGSASGQGADSGAAPSAGEVAATLPDSGEQTKSLLDVYKSGGSMMHILALMFIGTVAVAAYCFLQVSAGKMVPKRLVDGVNRTMAERDINAAYSLCQENPNSYSRVLSQGLLKVNFDRDRANKASMDEAAAETLDQEETKQMIWVNYLNVFATLAPMLGLLGTVWGMIEAFDQLMRGADAKGLAGGISTAMVTTAGGLLVGIPAMFFYFFFRNRLMTIMSVTQRNVSFALDVLSGEIQLQGAVAPVEQAVAPVEQAVAEEEATGTE